MIHGPILVINAGSSSVKFSLYRAAAGRDLAAVVRGQIEGIGTAPRMNAKDGNNRTLVDQDLDASEIRDARAALAASTAWLRPYLAGETIAAVGHRVVHGGAKYSHPVVIDRDTLAELRELIPLVPLHQPYNLAGIEAVFERLPDVPQVACFDTAFHRGHAPVAEIIPLPWELYQSGVRRYGFHGLSYDYIASVLPEVAPEIAAGRVIIAHLGSGASLCAIKNGGSVDTTLSFTALDGLCMGTRPGAVDPGAILYLFQNLGLSVKAVETLLYRKSGLLGISGVSNDMRALLGSQEPRARLAVDYFIYRTAKEIGALAAVLGGLDGLVFTAGIGENSPEIRRRICESCAWLGVVLDEEANARGATRISAAGGRVSAWVIATNEELMIARQTAQLLGWTP